MARSLQIVTNWLLFASGTSSVGSAPAPVEATVRNASPPVPGWSAQPAPKRAIPEKSLALRIPSGHWVQVAYAVIDVFFVCLNWLLVFGIRFWPRGNARPLEYFWSGGKLGLPELHYAAFLMLYSALVLLFCNWQALYRTPRNRTARAESYGVFKAVLLATLLLSAFIYLSGAKILSRLVVLFAGVLNVVTLIVWRLWKRQIVLRRAASGIGTHNAVIIGAGKIGQELAKQIEENKLLGYRFIGFLDANHSTHPKLIGKVEDLTRIARAQFVDEVFITIPSERELVKSVTAQARLNRLSVKLVPELYDGLAWAAPISYVGAFPVMELHGEPIPTFGLFVKRVMDILISTASLALLSPFLALIATIIKIDSRGPAIYCSQRVGKKARTFKCYKFRTMVLNADMVKEQFRHLNERHGPTFKIADDPRITRVGRFLRKYSLDELPQLWNVLRGEMSLVGPRPHPLDDYSQYELRHLRRLDVKPGVTGLWQIAARQDPSFETNMRLDLEYIENWNLWFDVKILSRTLSVVFYGSGA